MDEPASFFAGGVLVGALIEFKSSPPLRSAKAELAKANAPRSETARRGVIDFMIFLLFFVAH
jgi:hypothetical protein